MAFAGLPEELMTLILSKLPVKTLLRCKCVRKSWYSLINSPQFIRLHRSSSSSSHQFIVSHIQFGINRTDDEEQVTHSSKNFLSFHSYETLDDLGNDIHFSNRFSLSAPCDGLVCITNHVGQGNINHVDQMIFICNPSMREQRSLFVPPSFFNRSGYHIDSVAFGSDPNRPGEYKVVMIGVPYDNSHLYDPDIPDEDCFLWTPPGEDEYGDREVKVYDFSTDSWRDTAIVVPGPYRYSPLPVSVNGAFHWLPGTWRYERIWIDILTFLISDEVTESIPLPDSDFVDIEYINFIELCVISISSKSHLALFLTVWKGEDIEFQFEICVMTEYGVKESWTRLFQIGPMMNIDAYIEFWDEQHILLVHEGVGQLFSYDLQHQNHLRYFPIFGVEAVYLYSESLVSVNVLP